MNLVSILYLLVIAAVCNGACPVWTAYNIYTQQCECGDSVDGVVLCDPDTRTVSLLRCYCMTHNEDANETVVGPCIISCLTSSYCSLTKLDKGDLLPGQLNQKMCGNFKRTGQMCGKCVDNFSLPAYSYSQVCVKCSADDFKRNIVKYLCVAFIPLTVFYFVVVLFRISITSGNMVGYILACQVVMSPIFVRSILAKSYDYRKVVEVIVSLFGVWNLDFFRSLYPPFCIHPEMTAMQVLALDYLIAVYPLFLIFLTYIAVSLHDRYPIVVKMWKPAYRVFSCIRKEWKIRGSLVQAFASFLVLSYVKTLNVSFDLLRFVYLYNVKGEVLDQTYFYSDAGITYFGHEHLPYGLLALVMCTIFNLLPMILLLLYPCRCFQRCLNRCGVRSHLLHTLMDVFQGCYHHQPRDCRYFAGIYLGVRIATLLLSSIILNLSGLSVGVCFFTILAILVFFTEPYKIKINNKLDAAFFLFIAMLSPSLVKLKRHSISVYLLSALICSMIFLFFMYGVIIIAYKILPLKFVSSVRNYCQNICRKQKGATKMAEAATLPKLTFKEDDENSQLLY